MIAIMEYLNRNPKVSGWKINVHNKESYELFFVKGQLETVRVTDTCDKEVTVYVDHGEFKGDAQFFVYPSTTTDQLEALIDEAVSKALLIANPAYDLPLSETGDYQVPSNFSEHDPADLAALIAGEVFSANQVEHASLNAVEVFINKHTQHIRNSNGLNKSQTHYDAMVEAIPTFNGAQQSVELYEQYNFSNYSSEDISREIAGKMKEVRARYEATPPAAPIDCPVILNKLELSELFSSIVRNLNYSSVYSHANVFSKGDAIQKELSGDPIGITMRGSVTGNIRSSGFDGDGLKLESIRLVEGGKAVNYYGANRYGQYLGEKPTGNLGCICADPGSISADALQAGPALEVVSMSGLQVDFFSDYIGGEVRLAYYNDGEKITPVTGISIAGKVSEVLSHIRLSSDIATYDGYTGPAKAVLSCMKIF